MANKNSVHVCLRVCVGEKEKERQRKRQRHEKTDRQTDRWGLEKKDPSNIRTDITAHI